jgi:hypothetical protein
MEDILGLNGWHRYIDSLTWIKGQLDQSSYWAFLRARSFGIGAQAAFEEVSNRIWMAGDYPKISKLKSQLQRAYQFAGQSACQLGAMPFVSRYKPVFEPEKLRSIAQHLATEITDQWLNERSPVTPWNRSPAGILHKLFRQGERVFVFTDYRSQGEFLWEHPGPSGNLAPLNQFQNGLHAGVWFLSNPVDGEWKELKRLEKESNPSGRTRRAEENITAWRYAVLESDSAPRKLWLRALVQIPLPIAAITESGGSSVHALVRIDAATKNEWDSVVRKNLLPVLTTLGADPGALTAVRLTRLGNCERKEKGQIQRLLYLDPQADGTPIYQKPVRESATGAHERLAEAFGLGRGRL